MLAFDFASESLMLVELAIRIIVKRTTTAFFLIALILPKLQALIS
jgi:hypothetical protein